MSNSAQLKEMALAFNNVLKSNKVFENAQVLFENKKESDSFDKDTLYSMRAEYERRLAELEKFEHELDKFQQFMPESNFKELKNALGNQKMHLGKMCGDISGFLELGNQDMMDDLINCFTGQQLIGETLSKEFQDFNRDLGFNIFFRAMKNEIDLMDLRIMAAAFESNSDLVENINRVISFVERRDGKQLAAFEPESLQRKPEEKKEEQPVEQPKAVETVQPQEEVVEEEKQEAAQPATVKPPEPTLEEKIEAVRFHDKGNINRDVQNITIEDRLAGITKDIASLETKEKLTVKDRFRLHQLKEQQLAFEAYVQTLENQATSRRENKRDKKLETTVGKINGKLAKLNEAQEMSAQYRSGLMRYLSSRYQEKLNGQIAKLTEKEGTLEAKQRVSAVARFDKKSKKLMRQAKRKGTINQLKEFRDSIVTEVGAIQSDLTRFRSATSEQIERIKNGTVVAIDRIPSIVELQAMQQAAMARAA